MADFSNKDYKAADRENAAYDKAREQNAIVHAAVSDEHDMDMIERDFDGETDYPADTSGIPRGDGSMTPDALDPLRLDAPSDTIEDVVQELVSGEDTAGDPELTAAIVDAANEPIDFQATLAAISDEDATVMAHRAVKAIDERADFEHVKDPDNTKIQGTLKKVRATLTSLDAARVLIATNVDPVVFNRVIHEGARYNVYAMGKLADAIRGVSVGAVSNAINLACMKSLFRFRAAGAVFTHDMAKCAASDKIRVERAVNEMLVRHTVSASTAPTQASSTMQALETLGIVARTGGGKNPTFTLTANPIVDRLQKALAA